MFKIGQNSLEVVQSIVRENKEIVDLRIISHKVSENWRQIHPNSTDKISHLIEALHHPQPIREETITREEFLKISLNDLDILPADEVWSLTSRVSCNDGTEKHIPMMNFHPDDISFEELKCAIKTIMPNFNGAILSSGRFFHYYGIRLLNQKEWIKFLTDFLMPCVLVSPRYIGHRIFNGYCTLRLTADQYVKKKIPEVIDILRQNPDQNS